MLITSFGKGVFFFLQCEQKRVVSYMQLSEGKGGSMTVTVCRDESRRKLNFFGETVSEKK